MLYSQLPVVAPGNAIEIQDSLYYDHSDKSDNKTTFLMNIVSKSYNPTLIITEEKIVKPDIFPLPPKVLLDE